MKFTLFNLIGFVIRFHPAKNDYNTTTVYLSSVIYFIVDCFVLYTNLLNFSTFHAIIEKKGRGCSGMSDLTFPQRLKELRKEKRFTQNDLGDYLGVGKTTISNYETGYSMPDSATLGRLADIFSVSVDFMLGRSALPREEYNSPAQTLKRIAVVGIIRAGEPILASHNIIEYVDMPEQMVCGGEFFGLKVVGDSMDRSRIHDGDVVIVRKQEIVENGQIAVIMLENENATVKRFYQNGRFITLMPDSSNHIYEPQTIDIAKTDAKIIGRVVNAIIKL